MSLKLAAFIASLDRYADPANTPLADSIPQNVPIYRGDLKITADLLDEWARVLKDGPGIVVIKGVYTDHSIIDRATEIFETIIVDEQKSGTNTADHFAKPGANDRIWNALQKHCMADSKNYAHYYANPMIHAIALAWLGPGYQMTAQVNRVNPGGAAQSAHRDYHLGFMTSEKIAQFPAHVHALSPMLTLQGAIAHCDMPLESGPTLYLPFSQLFPTGYTDFSRPEFQKYFRNNHVQLPLEKGDAVFFNPALMHGSGDNTSSNIRRSVIPPKISGVHA